MAFMLVSNTDCFKNSVQETKVDYNFFFKDYLVIYKELIVLSLMLCSAPGFLF